MLVMGFVDDFKKELPMEYAVELNRLLAINMGGN
jgi:Fe-S cluster assembly protein SufB